MYRTIVITFLLLMSVLTPGCYTSEVQNNTEETGNGGYNLEDLNAYGEWVNIDTYGNVWHPYAVNYWVPFDNGHWVYADANWTWVSYEPFGWIVYHYGYWYDDPFYGWVWIPSDDIWSPANVMWYNYDDYICWAPLAPQGVAYSHPWEARGNRQWHVVRARDFTRDNIRDYRIPNPAGNDAGIINNRQPDRMLVEKYTGSSVPEIIIQRETVKLPQRKVERMNLPQQENKRVEQNSPRVRKIVLVPKEEYHKNQTSKNKRKE